MTTADLNSLTEADGVVSSQSHNSGVILVEFVRPFTPHCAEGLAYSADVLSNL
jgi:hypothetical protein